MEIIGYVAVAVVGATVITGLVVGIRSIPDVQRYLRIRNM